MAKTSLGATKSVQEAKGKKGKQELETDADADEEQRRDNEGR
jgi:hypothetical protein